MTKKELRDLVKRYRFLAPIPPKFIKGQKVKKINGTEIYTVYSVGEIDYMIGYIYALKDKDNKVYHSQGFMEYDLELVEE